MPACSCGVTRNRAATRITHTPCRELPTDRTRGSFYIGSWLLFRRLAGPGRPSASLTVPLSWSVEGHPVTQTDAPAFRVLLVVDDPKRQALLQSCVQRHLPECCIDTVDSYYDAMARATRLQTDLLVLDLSLDSVLVPALKRFLARAAPHALVHVFDDAQDNAPGAATGCNRPSIVQLKQSFSALTRGRHPFP